jgi:hypothetical protein
MRTHATKHARAQARIHARTHAHSDLAATWGAAPRTQSVAGPSDPARPSTARAQATLATPCRPPPAVATQVRDTGGETGGRDKVLRLDGTGAGREEGGAWDEDEGRAGGGDPPFPSSLSPPPHKPTHRSRPPRYAAA